MSSPPALLELRGIVVDAGGRSILDVPQLALPAERTTAVLGANGAGKTTLLRVISGVIPARAGTLTFEGAREAHDGREARLADAARLGSA